MEKQRALYNQYETFSIQFHYFHTEKKLTNLTIWKKNKIIRIPLCGHNITHPPTHCASPFPECSCHKFFRTDCCFCQHYHHHHQCYHHDNRKMKSNNKSNYEIRKDKKYDWNYTIGGNKTTAIATTTTTIAPKTTGLQETTRKAIYIRCWCLS